MLQSEAWKVDAKTTAYFTRGKWFQWKTPNKAPIKGVGYKPTFWFYETGKYCNGLKRPQMFFYFPRL